MSFFFVRLPAREPTCWAMQSVPIDLGMIQSHPSTIRSPPLLVYLSAYAAANLHDAVSVGAVFPCILI